MNRKSLFFIIMAGILWGTSCIFVHLWQAFGPDPMQTTTFRIVSSAILLWSYALLFDRRVLNACWKDLPIYLGSGATLLGTSAFYYAAMQASSISTAVVLMYTAPVLVMIWSVLFWGESFNRGKGLCVLCMLIGCGLVSGIADGMNFDPAGILFGLCSALSYGMYNIFTKVEMRRGCNPVTATLYSFLFAALFSLCMNDPKTLITLLCANAVQTIPLALVHGAVTFVLPYFLYTLAMKTIPAGVASSLAIMEPMSATLFGVILFQEKLSVFAVIGIILILGAVWGLSHEEV